MSVGEFVAIVMAASALLSALIALRQTASKIQHETRDAEEAAGSAIDSITAAAQRAVDLTTAASEERIADLEKQVAEFLEIIGRLNNDIGKYKAAGEEGSRTLYSALCKLDEYRAESLSWQERFVRLEREADNHIRQIGDLQFQISQLVAESSEQVKEIGELHKKIDELLAQNAEHVNEITELQRSVKLLLVENRRLVGELNDAEGNPANA